MTCAFGTHAAVHGRHAVAQMLKLSVTFFFFFFRIACCVVHACDRSVCNPTSGICVYIYINILKERSSRLKKKCTDL